MIIFLGSYIAKEHIHIDQEFSNIRQVDSPNGFKRRSGAKINFTGEVRI